METDQLVLETTMDDPAGVAHSEDPKVKMADDPDTGSIVGAPFVDPSLHLDYEAFVAQHEDGPCDVSAENPIRNAIPELARRESQSYDYNEQQLKMLTQKMLPVEMVARMDRSESPMENTAAK